MSRYPLAAESVAEILLQREELATSQWAFAWTLAHPFVWEVQGASALGWESMSMRRSEQASVGRSDSQAVGRRHLRQLQIPMI